MKSIRALLGLALFTLAFGASAAVQTPKQPVAPLEPVAVAQVQATFGALTTDQAFHAQRFKKTINVAVGDWYCRKMDWRCNEYGDLGACAMYDKYCSGGA